MATSADTISTNATKPRQVSADGVTVQQHSIPDQIRADEYARQKAASNKRTLPIRLAKIKPGGAIQ